METAANMIDKRQDSNYFGMFYLNTLAFNQWVVDAHWYRSKSSEAQQNGGQAQQVRF